MGKEGQTGVIIGITGLLIVGILLAFILFKIIPNNSSQCSDTDTGINYYEKGIVSYKTTQETDSCNGNNLKEWYCKQETKRRYIAEYEIYSCRNGCSNGACTPSNGGGNGGGGDNNSGEVKTYSNIQYKSVSGVDSNLLSLDIYTNTAFTNNPVIIMIHGGLWYTGDKSNNNVINPKKDYYLNKGFVFVSINYRLTDDANVHYPDNINDVSDAIKWVNQNIDEYGGNENNLYLMGHSAGAHLASLAVLANFVSSSYIKGLILLDSGDYDVLEAYNNAKDRTKQVYETTFSSREDIMKEASPINHISSGKNLPKFLIFYASDRAEDASPSQSKNFYNKLIDNGYTATLKGVSGKTHEMMDADVGKPKDTLTIAIDNFLGV
jgi:acetyl esterase/lipase